MDTGTGTSSVIFKRINDLIGHSTGSHVLSILRQSHFGLQAEATADGRRAVAGWRGSLRADAGRGERKRTPPPAV